MYSAAISAVTYCSVIRLRMAVSLAGLKIRWFPVMFINYLKILPLGKEARWVGGFLQTPHFYFPSVSVASK